jgi:glycyl-tRNA synthetase
MTDFVDTPVGYYNLGVAPLSQLGGAAPAAKASSSKAPASKPKPPAPPPIKITGGTTVKAVPDQNPYEKTQKDLQELCKRRFFFRQAFDIYGGVGGFWTYGPPGCAMKNNLIRAWRQHFVITENLLEIEDTCIMQHAVLKASGHVDRFNDFMVKDVVDESRFFRADKLLEDVMDAKLAEPGITEEQRVEFTSVRNQADAYSKEEIAEVFRRYQIKAPETGADLSDPYEFNLMFPTPIGPDGYLQGYLRPETAQGIFLNYKYCCEQNANRLPFGVAQVGRAFRNEIAPGKGLTRQREFTQGEIEYFVDPQSKAHPKFKEVADLHAVLFPSGQQLAAEDPIKMRMGDAVSQGAINNETLGYYMARTYMFLLSVGIREEHLRFRQHLPTEMAHYAADCWDAEIFTSYGWLECVGIADRSCFDLNAHAQATKSDLQYKQQLEKPIINEIHILTKQAGIAISKTFKQDGPAVKESLESFLRSADAAALQSLDKQIADTGSYDYQVGDKSFALKKEHVAYEKKVEKTTVRSFTPGVIEPSFGIDRIFFSMLEHGYYARPKDNSEDDKQIRGVLSFAARISPYKLSILPLDQRISRDEKYTSLLTTLRAELSSLGLSYTMDESSATIGRRYSRNDELGVPFALTFDFQTLQDSTVTLRERDAMDQIRLPLSGLSELINDLCAGEVTWAATMPKFPHRRSGEEEWSNPK